MRLVKFSAAGVNRVGVWQNGYIDELSVTWDDMLELATKGAGRAALPAAERTWAVEDCTLQAPLSDEGRPIFCLGLNYIDHEAEAGSTLGVQHPTSPVLFVKQ